MEIYIFSPDDKLLTILTEETGLISAPYRDELNQIPDTPLTMVVEADIEDAKHVKEQNKVVFRDLEGDLRELTIKEIDDSDGIDGPETLATCFPTFVDELSDKLILDRRFIDKEAQYALDVALENTRYIGVVEVPLGLKTTNFYKITSVDAIWKIRNIWGGDIKDVVELDENGRISVRKIIIKQRLGADKGAWLEIDHNIEEIQRTVLSYPKTAMYGWGASLETEEGGYTRYIDFADVEWSVANGNPVDKPLGQKWVGDPDALSKYGIPIKGELIHRDGQYNNQNIEDPEELLWATWNALQTAKEPEVNYRLKADLMDKEVSLGDTARAIDREFSRPIEIQTRIIAVEYDLLDPENTLIVEMGQFLKLQDDRIEQIKETINKNRGKWEGSRPVTDDSFPNVIPGPPTGLVALGAFSKIILSWDYLKNSAISHYELFASEVQGFVPGPEHLIWRGRTGSFIHETEVNKQWYYRLRAVNYHDNASDFSDEVSATTLRINADTQIAEETITKHLLAREAIIESIHIGEAQVKDIHITGVISSPKVSIGEESTYEEGYDPSQKAGVDDLNNVIEEYQSAIEIKADEINLNVNEKIINLEENLTQQFNTDISATRDAFEIQFSETNATLEEYGEQLTEISSSFRFTPDGLEIGKSESPLNIVISNEEIGFLDNGVMVSYINGQKMYIDQVEILNSLIVGVHKIEKYDETRTLVKWVGE